MLFTHAGFNRLEVAYCNLAVTVAMTVASLPPAGRAAIRRINALYGWSDRGAR